VGSLGCRPSSGLTGAGGCCRPGGFGQTAWMVRSGCLIPRSRRWHGRPASRRRRRGRPLQTPHGDPGARAVLGPDDRTLTFEFTGALPSYVASDIDRPPRRSQTTPPAHWLDNTCSSLSRALVWRIYPADVVDGPFETSCSGSGRVAYAEPLLGRVLSREGTRDTESGCWRVSA
jgi:hypothetical protein